MTTSKQTSWYELQPCVDEIVYQLTLILQSAMTHTHFQKPCRQRFGHDELPSLSTSRPELERPISVATEFVETDFEDDSSLFEEDSELSAHDSCVSVKMPIRSLKLSNSVVDR